MGVLTKRESEVLEFIKDYMRTTGIVPTMIEIGHGTNMSTKAANNHFRRLVDKGYVVQVSDKRYVVKGMKYVEQ